MGVNLGLNTADSPMAPPYGHTFANLSNCVHSRALVRTVGTTIQQIQHLRRGSYLPSFYGK